MKYCLYSLVAWLVVLSVYGVNAQNSTLEVSSNEPSPAPESISDYPSVSFASDQPSIVPTAPPTMSEKTSSTAPTESSSVSSFGSPKLTVSPVIASSETPSTVLSRSPSFSPTNVASAVPSDFPTSPPSRAPSPIPTSPPTVSKAPSSEPSPTPSLVPSVSTVPSPEPSSKPSSKPTRAPSFVPSAVPSQAPSAAFSSQPTDAPSTSRAPSVQPSPMPSDLPSLVPSVNPTRTPTLSPSQIPSINPTVSPSTSPSISPSLQCHDEITYRSPLNNFECKDHKGTDCIQWRFLGLNIDQVIELVHNCPISCKIDCGSLQSFEGTLSFGLVRVSSFLAPKAVSTLESISTEYLTNYIQGREPDSRFFLQNVELLSQKIYGSRMLRSTSQGRRLASVSLVLTVTYRGNAINLASDTVQEYLVDGIGSNGYARSLQRSGDPSLTDVQISSSVEGLASFGGATSDETKNGRGGAAAAVVLSAIFIFAITAFIFHFRKRKLDRIQKKSQAIETGPEVVSPVASLGSSLAQVFSFESIVRMMSSPRSDSTPTVASSRNSEPTKTEELAQASPASSASVPEVEEEHPLTGVIPPMIVFDNIEDTMDTHDAEILITRNVVPFRRMDASPEFAAKLRSGAGQIDESLVVYFPEGEESSYDGDSDEFYSAASSQSNNDSNSDSENDTNNGREANQKASSVSSAPVEISVTEEVNEDVKVPEKTSEPRRVISESESMLRGGIPPTIPTRKLQSRGRRKPSWVSSDGTPSPNGHKLDLTLTDYSLDDRNTIDLSNDHSDSKTIDTHQSGGFMQSILQLSPARKIRKVLTSSTDGSPQSTSSGPTKRYLRRSSSRESDCSVDKVVMHNGEKGRELVFKMPRHGKLGLTILCDAKGLPTVQHVKDYSPLLDKVMPKDLLVSIDGKGTHGSTLSDVTGLLGRKAGSRWAHTKSTTMDIVFWRAIPEEEDGSSDLDPQGFSFDSSSLARNRRASSFDSTNSAPHKIRMPSLEGSGMRRSSSNEANDMRRSSSTANLAHRRASIDLVQRPQLNSPSEESQLVLRE